MTSVKKNTPYEEGVLYTKDNGIYLPSPIMIPSSFLWKLIVQSYLCNTARTKIFTFLNRLVLKTFSKLKKSRNNRADVGLKFQ